MLLNFDLNIVRGCNLSCKYCFEPKEEIRYINQNVIEGFANFIGKFYKFNWFKSGSVFNGINIRFWRRGAYIKYWTTYIFTKLF